MAAGQPIVAVRYPPAELEIVDAAREVMGQTVSQFTRSASVALARAILEASASSGITRTTWDATWFEDVTIERKAEP